MFHHVKFFLFHVMVIAAIASLLIGGIFIPLAFAITCLVLTAGDNLMGDDLSTPSPTHIWVYDFQLFSALPLLLVLFAVFTWLFSATDPLSMGALISSTFGFDAMAAKSQTATWEKLVALPYVALIMATAGTVTAHELVHRGWHRASMITGRWLLAFSFDSNFSIEHVFGHHRNVATADDPASAPRGRSVYRHIFLSTIRGNISAWRIEARRLKGRKHSVLSHHNLCLRGYAMSGIVVMAAYVIGGLDSMWAFIAAGLMAKALLEIVNYIEHYGLVRIPGKRVEVRHSWNTNKKMSSWTLFNLPRHAHHHAKAQVPFYNLSPYANAPTLPAGYLSCIFLAMVPPLWKHLMAPRLAEWDEHMANDEERKLIRASVE